MVAGRNRSASQNRERDQCVGRPGLDHARDRKERARDREDHQDARRAPRIGLGGDHAVHQRRQRRGDRQRAWNVKAPCPALHALHLWQCHAAEHENDNAERNIHEHHRPPAQHVGQRATKQHAQRTAGSGRHPPHRKRSGPRARLGVRRCEKTQRPRRQQRRPNTLDRPRRQQHASVGRHPAGETRRREDEPADQIHALAAEMIAQPSAEQDQPAQGQQVGVDDPLKVARTEMQSAPHCRQRHVHDRRVQHDHELTETRRGQRCPHWHATRRRSHTHFDQPYPTARADVVASDPGKPSTRPAGSAPAPANGAGPKWPWRSIAARLALLNGTALEGAHQHECASFSHRDRAPPLAARGTAARTVRSAHDRGRRR